MSSIRITSARWRMVLVAAACASALIACGGGGGGATGNGSAPVPPASLPLAFGTATSTGSGALPAPGANVLPITFDRGMRGTSFNSPYVTVTLCTPGGSTCREIDHVLVDTGSYGLRLLASALPAELALPAVRTTDGAAVAQCVQFTGGFAWGSVRTADVRLGSQMLASLPVQVIDDPSPVVAAPPARCRDENTNLGTRLGANGVLGVGMLRYDCGPACATSVSPAIYFGCAGGTCTSATVPLASQVANPIPALTAHNNGVSVTVQRVPSGGAATLAGALVLGIGTAANNQLEGAEVFGVDSGGLLVAGYKGASYPAFLDTGSNALFLPDTDLPACGDFFCPVQLVSLDVSLQAPNGTRRSVGLPIESPGALAVGTVAASIGGNQAAIVTLGAPFFFGRTVFLALKDAATPAGTGPYWAF
jgi:hypothetical protein